MKIFLVVKFSRASQVKLELGNRSMMMVVTRSTPETLIQILWIALQG